MTTHFTTARLDGDTLAYLRRVSAARGKRMPGIYNGRPNYWPVISLLTGLAVVVVTALVTFPPTEEPTKEALLQTAGFLLGGWLILAAVRIWMATTAGTRIGNFIYADSRNLYEVSASGVNVTDLTEIDEAMVTQNFKEGAYQNSHIAMKMGPERKSFTVYSEKTGRDMSVFLNSLAYIRAGGEDGRDDVLKNMPPEQMAAVAKYITATGTFPSSLADVDETDAVEIPAPRRGAAGVSGGFLWYFIILGAGAAMFVGFRTVNWAVREDTLYARIMGLPPKEQPSALRLYLSRPDFQKHRAEAQSKLETAYRQGAVHMIAGKDETFAEAMRTLVMSLAKQPQPVISLAVEEEEAGARDVQAQSREDATATELADKWGSAIGDELVSFARPDSKDIKPMIHVAYRRGGPNVTYTVTFRTGPDEAPYKTVSGTYTPANNPNPFAQPRPPVGLGFPDINPPPSTAGIPGFTDYLLVESCGRTVTRPLVLPDEDF